MLLNVFYNGTDSNYNRDFQKEERFIHGEIISQFGFYAQKVEENKSRILRIHGIGGSKEDGNIATDKLGRLFGVRMRDDVQTIVKFVMKAKQEQLDNKDKEMTVTLMGWSRGGIGCIYAAHIISKMWDSIENPKNPDIKLDVRIIAFDPVSGIGTNVRALDISWSETLFRALVLASDLATKNSKIVIDSLFETFCNQTNWWELPEHVTQFHGFYARDERSIGFATTMPTMLGEIGERVFNLYEVPGTHSTLVGNLYPNGGAEPATDGNPDPIGLIIYRDVVEEAHKLLSAWGVTFDISIEEWLKPLREADKDLLEANMSLWGKYTEYRKQAQKIAITISPISVPLLTDGRGVYLGGNKQDRKWKPESTLTEFLREQNSKSFVDSIWQHITGQETKLKKLGGGVSAYDYKFHNTDNTANNVWS